VSERVAAPIEVAAPAKLNLGLEVLARRDDGFHEIATIFLAIDLQDRLTFAPSDQILLRCDDPAVAGEENLVLRALRELRREALTPLPPSPTAAGEGERKPLAHRNGPGAHWAAVGVRAGAAVDLVKRIPVAAGLGGASSDAAAALRGGRELWRLDLADDALRGIAAGLGSDVPFFLDGGCALGRGRGEMLTALPIPRDRWFVVVVPLVKIPAKTATLYASLTASDLSDGARVAAQAERLRAGGALDSALLGNAFARALYARCPELADLPAIMRDTGAPGAAITGAGPAHYAAFDDAERAARVADRLRERFGNRAEIIVAAPLREPFTAARPL
jgi:4-diphosphocytidyl-2-C-methyl-D-erythritol kinase